MYDKEEIIKLLNLYFNIYLDTTNIGNLRYKMSRETPVPNINKYDNVSITSFLVLYKIDKLLEFNIITNNIANSLKELYTIREQLMDEYQEIISNMACNIKNHHENKNIYYIEKEDVILKKIQLIDQKLKQYNLDFYDYNRLVINFSRLIDNDIKINDYYNVDNDSNLDNFVKSLKKDYYI